jgi:hypothetical protein
MIDFRLPPEPKKKSWLRRTLGDSFHLVITAIGVVLLFSFPPGVIVLIIALTLMED